MHASMFTNKENLEINVRINLDKELGNYPTIVIAGGSDRLTIFPSFRQVHQLHAALENLLMEMEPYENEE